MCFAVVLLIVTNIRVITMHKNRDTQKEILIIEATVWVYWTLFFGVIYILFKAIS